MHIPLSSSSVLCGSIHAAFISENFYISEHLVHARLYHTARNLVIRCLNHSVVLLCNYLLSAETHSNHLECRNCTVSIFVACSESHIELGTQLVRHVLPDGLLPWIEEIREFGMKTEMDELSRKTVVRWIFESHRSHHHASVSHIAPCTKEALN